MPFDPVPVERLADAEVVDVLGRALGRIDRRERWCRFAAWNASGAVCLGHAVSEAAGNDVELTDRAFDVVSAVIRRRPGYHHGSIPLFNDTAHHADVLNVLREAIANARGEGHAV